MQREMQAILRSTFAVLMIGCMARQADEVDALKAQLAELRARYDAMAAQQ